MSNIDIFQSAKPQGGEFFKFKSVGDSIQGTYIDVRNGIDSFGNQQTIYVIQDKEGKVWNLGFRQTALVIHERMNGIKFGQIVGYRFDEERESKRNPGTKVKIIRIYADPKLVDDAWLEHQRQVEATYSKPSAVVVSAEVKQEEEDFTSDLPDFHAPADAEPAKDSLPKTMSEEEADASIADFAEMDLSESNLTKIIIALTGYVTK
jgi:hypothetical protein